MFYKYAPVRLYQEQRECSKQLPLTEKCVTESEIMGSVFLCRESAGGGSPLRSLFLCLKLYFRRINYEQVYFYI